MREIKFRAWNKKRKRMYEVLHLHLDSFQGVWATVKGRDVIADKDIHIQIQPKDIEVMQWTGLNDSKGTPIYEGDIVGCESNGVERYQARVICYDSHQAKYKTVPRNTYYANAGNGGWTGYELRSECELLGNIYENPELLEETK